MITKSVLITAPASLAVDLTTVKTFLRVDGTAEDTLITSMIKAATKRLEAETDQKFFTQTWDVYLDSFPTNYKNNDQWWDGTRDGAISEMNSPCNYINLPFGPVQSITYFKTYDEDNTEYTFTSTLYSTDLISPVPKIALKIGSAWPQTVLRPVNGIQIRGVFGYATVPDDIQEAIKQMVGILYEHRGDEMPKIPTTVSMLIEPYRRMKI